MKQVYWLGVVGLLLGQLRAVGQGSMPFEKIFFTPTVSIGYTVGAKLKVGVGFEMTTSVTKVPTRIKRTGLSLGHYWVMGITKDSPHRISSLEWMYENEFTHLKTGAGLVQHKWGYSKVNEWGVLGWTADVAFTKRDAGLPWVGFKSFVYPQHQWIWFDQPYASLYVLHKMYLNAD